MGSGDEPVYEEWKSRLVTSGHGDGIHYRVFYGTVNWTRQSDDLRRATVVFVQYGSEPDWHRACSSKEIDLRHPAHILDEDLRAVKSAIDEVNKP